MTNANLTGILMIQDRSGSMDSVRSDTEGGFNAFIDSQKQVPGETRVTLVQFDDQYETVYEGLPVTDVPPLVLRPRGMTALRDAIGRAVVTFGESLATLPEERRPSKVYCVISTDGLENASHEYSADQIKALITEQTNKYKWEFTFLGANQDAILTGETFGIPANASLSYAASAAGTQSVFASMGDAVTRSRVGGQSISYTVTERDAAMQDDDDTPPAKK